MVDLAQYERATLLGKRWSRKIAVCGEKTFHAHRDTHRHTQPHVNQTKAHIIIIMNHPLTIICNKTGTRTVPLVAAHFHHVGCL